MVKLNLIEQAIYAQQHGERVPQSVIAKNGPQVIVERFSRTPLEQTLQTEPFKRRLGENDVVTTRDGFGRSKVIGADGQETIV